MYLCIIFFYVFQYTFCSTVGIAVRKWLNEKELGIVRRVGKLLTCQCVRSERWCSFWAVGWGRLSFCSTFNRCWKWDKIPIFPNNHYLWILRLFCECSQMVWSHSCVFGRWMLNLKIFEFDVARCRFKLWHHIDATLHSEGLCESNNSKRSCFIQPSACVLYCAVRKI